MAPWANWCVAMEHDIFFSISQTPDEHGHIPNEATMLQNYFQQRQANHLVLKLNY